MIKTAMRPIISVILLVLCAVNGFSQIELGPHRFVSPPAPALRNPTHLRMGLRQARFLGRVGGVAFDAEAKPADGFIVGNVSLSYHPDQPDGERLRIKFDEREVVAPIYDWQLIPIAKFADSKSFSCVTLFGDLDDPQKNLEVRRAGGNVINYHEEFVDTLLGLRLFQLDMLILDKYAADLPRQNGKYVLGKGESEPEVKLNREGFFYFQDYLTELMQQVNEKFSSYVINDLHSDIKFGMSGTSLTITGEPHYYFWRKDYYSSFGVEQKVGQELGAAARRRPFNTKQWLMSRVIEKAREFEENYDVEASLRGLDYVYGEAFIERLKGMLALNGDMARRRYLQQETAASLKTLLINLRETMEGEKPVSLENLSRQVSAHPELLRKINPAIWDSGVNVMRYAAFFRYCEHRSPQQWQSFITQIRQVRGLSPSISTPTVIYYGR